MDHLKKLKELERESYLLSHAIAVLYWDQETYMPENAVEERAEQIALLEGMLHKKQTEDSWGEIFESLKPENLSELDQALLKETSRRYKRKVKLPVDLVERFAAEVSIAQSKWVKAKGEENFNIFSPHLEKLVSYSREMADLIGYENHPYDALLDEYEPWMTAEEVKSEFDKLEPGLRNLIERIKKAPQVDSSFLDQEYPVELQDKFGRILQEGMGYDYNRGRLDQTAHPFTSTLGFNDVRVTTHYHSNDLLSAIFSNIHEGGHGQYEQGFAEELKYTLLADGTSMGIHESQSRFWENIVGRDIHFWSYYYPELVKIFPEQLNQVSLDHFYKAVNKVEPSLVRIEADEVTYTMHVILRFRMEMALIAGELSIKDLPEAWNAESEKLLGIKSTTLSKGVLQDIHWSAGLFGYFPTYALGNLYGAQFTKVLKNEMPEYNNNLMTGNLKPIQDWLHDRIHKHGSSVSASGIIESISGGKLDSSCFMTYLEDKYKTVYDI